jgi:hypothetical protein
MPRNALQRGGSVHQHNGFYKHISQMLRELFGGVNEFAPKIRQSARAAAETG